MRIDCHNHTTYSPDAKQSPTDIVLAAINNGIGYLGITEHIDFGFPKSTKPADEEDFDYIITPDYFNDYYALRDKYKDKIEIVIGAEIGYTPDTVRANAAEIEKYPYEYIINAVHICHNKDVYWKNYFDGYTQKQAYTEYLLAVRESLDVPYRYDAVGHIGYIGRPSEFEENRVLYRDYSEIIDDILITLIKRDKILEVNSSVGNCAKNGSLTMPDVSILNRYYALGGRMINFGSDSHSTEKFNKNYYAVTELLKEIGYKEWTIVRNNKLCTEIID